MACGGPLPKNGEEWHAIRQGRLPYLGRYSIELHSLLEQMIHPDPAQRPSTQTLTQHPVLGPNGAKSKDQLSRELTAERLKNRQLSEKLQGNKQTSKKYVQFPSQIAKFPLNLAKITKI